MQPDLTRDQIETLHFLEGSIGPVQSFATDHPILDEFDLGSGAVVMEFDHSIRVAVRQDGGITPLPKLRKL